MHKFQIAYRQLQVKHTDAPIEGVDVALPLGEMVLPALADDSLLRRRRDGGPFNSKLAPEAACLGPKQVKVAENPFALVDPGKGEVVVFKQFVN